MSPRVKPVLSVIICLFGLSGCVGTDPTFDDAEADAQSDTNQADAQSDTNQQDTTNPCDGVTCGGHGTCVEQTGQEIECVCESGYRPEAQTCVEINEDAPCEGVDCSGHGTCTVDGDDPVCECEDGYESGGSLSCIEIDPCDGVDCSGHGTCTVDGGDPVCACDSGYESTGPLTCVAVDPCEGQTCSGHGTCVANGGSASCQCDSQYEPSGLECLPEDKDGDGDPFTTDCDDNDPSINTGATELCDGVDNDCDTRIDEGDACGIWVLERRANTWESYPMDAAASGHAPTSTVRAAFDIEEEDFAFVLTDTGYQKLNITSLAWEAPQPLSDIDSDLTTVDGPGQMAIGFPSTFFDPDSTVAQIQIYSMRGGTQYLWRMDYDIDTGAFSYGSDGIDGEPANWGGTTHRPDPADVRAGWLDVVDERGWMDSDPSAFCDTTETSSDMYAAGFTNTHLHIYEAAYCYMFTDHMPLGQSPLAQPANVPPFDRIGAAFWHQGALYLIRGD